MIYRLNHRNIYQFDNLCIEMLLLILLGFHKYRLDTLCRRLGWIASSGLKIYRAHILCRRPDQCCHRCIGPLHNLSKLDFQFGLGTYLCRMKYTSFVRFWVEHNLSHMLGNWWNDPRHCWISLSGIVCIRFESSTIDIDPQRMKYRKFAQPRPGTCPKHSLNNHFPLFQQWYQIYPSNKPHTRFHIEPPM